MTVVLILFALLIYIVYIAVIKAKQKRLSNNSNKKENTAEDIIWTNDYYLYPDSDMNQSSNPYDNHNSPNISHHGFDRDNNIDSIDTNSHHSPH